MGFNQQGATTLLVDNQSAITMAKNPVHHGRTKHIRVKYHAIREAVKIGDIFLKHCRTDDQLADVLTKSLGKDKFELFRERLRVLQVKPQEGVLKNDA